MEAETAATETFATGICQRLRATAVALPEVTEGASCVNRAFKAGKKTFLFLGEKPAHIYAMLKLAESKDAAAALNDPRIEVGGNGWVTLRFQANDPPDPELLERWIVESYRVMATKKLLAQLA